MPPKTTKSSTSPSKKTQKDDKSTGKRKRAPSEDETYIVEKIQEKEKKNGMWLYKVKWQGYPEDQCTWEPTKNLESVKYMLNEFNRELKKKEEGENKEEQEKKSPTKGKESKKKSSKGKSSADKDAETEETKPKKGRGRPRKKVKTEKDNMTAGKDEESESESEEPEESGHFDSGDKANQILNAVQEKDHVMFLVEWKPRKDGKVPANTRFTNKELRKYDKDLLLDFYEARLKFIKPSEKGSMMSSLQGTAQKETNSGNHVTKEEKSGNHVNEVHMETENEGNGNENKDKGLDDMRKINDKGEEEPQGEKGEEEKKEGDDNIESDEDGIQKETEIEHVIDDTDQPVFADLNFQMAEDLRDSQFDKLKEDDKNHHEHRKKSVDFVSGGVYYPGNPQRAEPETHQEQKDKEENREENVEVH